MTRLLLVVTRIAFRQGSCQPIRSCAKVLGDSEAAKNSEKNSDYCRHAAGSDQNGDGLSGVEKACGWYT